MLNLRTSLVHFLLLSGSQLHRQINTCHQFNFPGICCDLRVKQLKSDIFVFRITPSAEARGNETEVSGKDRAFLLLAADLLWFDFAFTQEYIFFQLYFLLFRQFLSLLFFLLYPITFPFFSFDWIENIRIGCIFTNSFLEFHHSYFFFFKYC